MAPATTENVQAVVEQITENIPQKLKASVESAEAPADEAPAEGAVQPPAKASVTDAPAEEAVQPPAEASVTDAPQEATSNKANGHSNGHTTEAPPEPAEEQLPKVYTNHKEPLKLSGALDQYSSFDVTPVIGREFPQASLAEWLKAPNSDELIRDLAITSR